MQTAKEFQDQMEWFWLLCQEEAWTEDQDEEFGGAMSPAEWDKWEAHW